MTDKPRSQSLDAADESRALALGRVDAIALGGL